MAVCARLKQPLNIPLTGLAVNRQVVASILTELDLDAHESLALDSL
jgi:hypothetical protein